MYPIIIFHTESRIEVMPRNVSKGRAIKRALSYHSARRLSYSSSQNSPQSPVFEICQSSILCDFDVARDSLNVSDAINFQKLSFDFVFVAGNDRADEAMFECFSADTGGSLEGVDSVKTSIFTCTVGSKTSLAKYFVESPTALKNGIDELLNEDTTSEK
jgi:trehalose-6-phosphatase